jgi:hypothetical protein
MAGSKAERAAVSRTFVSPDMEAATLFEAIIDWIFTTNQQERRCPSVARQGLTTNPAVF